MKIRCEENSIRLRLRKSDIERLRTELSVRTEVNFTAGMGFSWELWLDPTATEVRADGYGSHISVALPHELAFEWMDSQTVGIEHFQKIDRSHNLHILIEKDFPCKDRPEENKADFFVELAHADAVAC